MRSKRPLRSSFVVTVGAVGALFGACGGTTGSGNPADCPATLPGGASACSARTSCSYTYDDKCPAVIATCDGVVWTMATGDSCPSGTPPAGAACCRPPSLACGPYFDGPPMCFGMSQVTSASCVGGKWAIELGSCNPPPPPDAGPMPDASAGDASSDAAVTDAMVAD